MLKGNWRDRIKTLASLAAIMVCCFAVGICYFWYLSYQHQNAKEYEEAANNYATYARQSIEACALGDQDVRLTCIADANIAQADAENAKKDLKAQQKMAEFALGVLFLSIFNFAATVVGAYFVWRTLQVTRQVGCDQSRAYVHIDKVELYWGDHTGSCMLAKIYLRNCGQTPARWFEIRYAFLLEELDEQGAASGKGAFEDIKFHGRDGEFVRWASLAASEQTNAIAQPENVEQVGHQFITNRGTHMISIAGTVRYETVYGEIAATDFWFGGRNIDGYRREKTSFKDGVQHFDQVPVKLSRLSGGLRSYQIE